MHAGRACRLRIAWNDLRRAAHHGDGERRSWNDLRQTAWVCRETACGSSVDETPLARVRHTVRSAPLDDAHGGGQGPAAGAHRRRRSSRQRARRRWAHGRPARSRRARGPGCPPAARPSAARRRTAGCSPASARPAARRSGTAPVQVQTPTQAPQLDLLPEVLRPRKSPPAALCVMYAVSEASRTRRTLILYTVLQSLVTAQGPPLARPAPCQPRGGARCPAAQHTQHLQPLGLCSAPGRPQAPGMQPTARAWVGVAISYGYTLWCAPGCTRTRWAARSR